MLRMAWKRKPEMGLHGCTMLFDDFNAEVLPVGISYWVVLVEQEPPSG